MHEITSHWLFAAICIQFLYLSEQIEASALIICGWLKIVVINLGDFHHLLLCYPSLLHQWTSPKAYINPAWYPQTYLRYIRSDLEPSKSVHKFAIRTAMWWVSFSTIIFSASYLRYKHDMMNGLIHAALCASLDKMNKYNTTYFSPSRCCRMRKSVLGSA